MLESNVRMPGVARAAQIALFVQAALNVLGIALLVLFAVERVDHGQRVDPMLWLVITLSLVLGVALLVCAIRFGKRPSWLRGLVTTVEVVVLINGLINVFFGLPAGGVGIALALAVLASMFNRATSAWLAGEHDGNRVG